MDRRAAIEERIVSLIEQQVWERIDSQACNPIENLVYERVRYQHVVAIQVRELVWDQVQEDSDDPRRV